MTEYNNGEIEQLLKQTRDEIIAQALADAHDDDADAIKRLAHDNAVLRSRLKAREEQLATYRNIALYGD